MRPAALLLAALALSAAEPPLAVLSDAASRLATEDGRAALKHAIEQAPDHAVFALRRSPALRDFARPHFPGLAELSTRDGIPDYARARLATLHRHLGGQALTPDRVLDYPSWFATLVSIRLSSGDATLDRILHDEAEFVRSAWTEGGESRRSLGLPRFAPRELYAVLAYGQREESEHTFAKFFDGEAAPRLGKNLGTAIEAAQRFRLREFLVEAIRAKRAAETAALLSPQWLARALQAIPSLEQAALAAEIVEAYANPQSAPALRAALEAEHNASNPYAGILAAWLVRISPSSAFPLAAEYARFLPNAESLSPEDFCERSRCLQRHIFFDDEDGVSSFASFEAQYRNDPRWTWEESSSHVKVSRNGPGRRVEIYANRPQAGTGAVSEAWDDATLAPQRALSGLIAQGPAPRVFVQRGHAYHVDKSLEFLPAEARLVFLGSCRGTLGLERIVERAPQAQVIATRSTGTSTINDPLLKAISDRLADGAIGWDSFWREQRSRFASSPLFDSYIPPHRNGPAILLQAWRNLQNSR